MTSLQLWGAGCFGAILGWYLYFINRYRTGAVDFGDLVTIIGIVGGGAILSLFPSGTDLFGAYGIGLAVGFFGYYIILVGMVTRSPNFDADYFLDGRRKAPQPPFEIPGYVRSAASSGMGETIDSASGSGPR